MIKLEVDTDINQIGASEHENSCFAITYIILYVCMHKLWAKNACEGCVRKLIYYNIFIQVYISKYTHIMFSMLILYELLLLKITRLPNFFFS